MRTDSEWRRGLQNCVGWSHSRASVHIIMKVNGIVGENENTVHWKSLVRYSFVPKEICLIIASVLEMTPYLPSMDYIKPLPICLISDFVL